MAKQSKTLHLMAVKLGLGEEDKVLSKATEFERLLQTKSTANTITDTAKVVICLDLAASYYKVDLDLKTAVRCSGLKTPSYTNSKKIVENLLELNSDKLTVSGLCLMLHCNVQELAERVLEEYTKSAKMEIDINLPQYVCMAVHQACRLSKVKVPKSKLVDKSQLKPAQWAKMDAEWTKFTDERFAVAKKKKGRQATTEVIDQEEKMEIDTEIIKKDEQIEPQTEPYEDWKRRILEAAYRDLEKLNKRQNKEKENSHKHGEVSPNKQLKNLHKKEEISPNKQLKNLHKKEGNSPNKQLKNLHKKEENSASKQLNLQFSPRRSPRKTPQKFEPYKSPAPGKGVRLLFR